MTLRLFQLLSAVRTMVSTLLRQFRKSLHIKKIVKNALPVLSFVEQPKDINQYQRKSVGYLFARTPRAQQKRQQKLHRKRSNNWTMVSFIHSESEIITWMSYSFKTKTTKSNAKQQFLEQDIFFESQAADYQISTRTPELYANSLEQLFLQLHL